MRLQIEDKTKELALFNPAINSKLRSGDLVAVKVSDVALIKFYEIGIDK